MKNCLTNAERARTWPPVLVLFVIVLAVRLLAVGFLGGELRFGDEVYYDRIADNIVQGHGVIAGEGNRVMRMPAYPAFLAVVKAIVPDRSAYFLIVRVMQALFSALLVLPFWHIARRILPVRASVVAVVLLCCNPQQNVFPVLLLTETIFSFLLIVCVALIFQYDEAQRVSTLVVAACVAAATMYMKESIVYFLAFTVAASACFRSWATVRTVACVMLVVAGIALVPWLLRNYAQVHAIVPFTTNAGFTLYDSFNPNADGGTDVSKFPVPEAVRTMSECERDRYWKRQTWREIRNDPWRAVVLAAKKQRHFWSVMPNVSGVVPPAMRLMFGVYYGALFAAAAVGCAIACVRRLRIVAFIILPVVFFALMHAVLIGSLRYRMPVEPFLIVLAMLPFVRGSAMSQPSESR